jgi:uncharacterized protein (DUF983 family)
MDIAFASADVGSGPRSMPTSQVSTLLEADLMRGLRGRCPCCGKGSLFRAFLKVSDQCRECGEELHHHRADDFPAYCVIFIVGHVLGPLVVSVEMAFAPSYWIHLALWLPIGLGMTLGLLQPVKGFIVALQWRLGMHGFEQAKQARAIAYMKGRLSRG